MSAIWAYAPSESNRDACSANLLLSRVSSIPQPFTGIKRSIRPGRASGAEPNSGLGHNLPLVKIWMDRYSSCWYCDSGTRLENAGPAFRLAWDNWFGLKRRIAAFTKSRTVGYGRSSTVMAEGGNSNQAKYNWCNCDANTSWSVSSTESTCIHPLRTQCSLILLSGSFGMEPSKTRRLKNVA